jgi:hypothetical protein
MNKYLRSIILLICTSGLLTIPFSGIAQQKTTIINLINQNKEAIPYASIKLTPEKDTLNRIQKVTDSAGKCLILIPRFGKYTITLQSVNYQTLKQTINIDSSGKSFQFILTPVSGNLQTIEIVARKPLLRQEDDKTIVDPEVLANSSTNAFEIMEKIPGLFVDPDGNIYLSSTTPATIYINGRQQKMSNADVASLLKSLPPGSIASIEIIRTPSAKYDASGGGGIVNVLLKKHVKLGLTGSTTMGMNQGIYGNQFAGFNLNNSNGDLTTYLNFQTSNNDGYNQTKTFRQLSLDTILNQNSLSRNTGNSIYVGFGLNYQLTKKWEISYDSRITFNNGKSSNVVPSQISKISNGQVFSSNGNNIHNIGKSANITQEVGLKYKIDSTGSEWNTDVSYSYAPNNNQQDYITSFTQPILFTLPGDGLSKNTFNFLSFQSNLVYKLKHKITVETGVKSTNTWYENNSDYRKQTNGIWNKDIIRTSAYSYKENIHAAYFQASKSFSKFILKTGVRVENTNMNGKQTFPNDTSFKIARTDAFPYVYLSRQLFKVANFDIKAYLVYRKTIARPSYEFLNPSIKIVDQYVYETGNPTLKPQFTQNYEANISANDQPIIAIGFNDTKDIFTQVLYQSDSNKNVTYRTYDNLGKNKETYFRFVLGIPPGKKYFFVAGTQYNHNFYNGTYANSPLPFKRGSWTAFTFHTYKLTKTTQLVMNGFIRFNGQYQFYELSTLSSLNFSITQKFLKNKLSVTASINDALYTLNNNFVLAQGNVKTNGYRNGDTRRFGLNLRYNFGIRKKDKEENNMFNMDNMK